MQGQCKMWANRPNVMRCWSCDQRNIMECYYGLFLPYKSSTRITGTRRHTNMCE